MRYSHILLVLVALLAVGSAPAADDSITVLHRFGPAATHPSDPLTFGSDGLLYGVAFARGGADARFFRVTAAGAIEDLGTIALSNARVIDVSVLTLGVDGKLWGTGSTGGDHPSGVAFSIGTDGKIEYATFGGNGVKGGTRMLPGGDGKMYFFATDVGSGISPLYRYSSGGPAAQVVILPKDSATLLAVTSAGMVGYYFSTTQEPVFFVLHTDGTISELAQLPDAGRPQCLLEGDDGSFYGVTGYGGSDTEGQFFRVSPDGSATVIADLTDAHGGGVSGQLALGDDGKFYAIAADSTYFRMAKDGAFESLATFHSADLWELTGLARGSDGAFYAAAPDGGRMGMGGIYRLAADGTKSTVASFEPYGMTPRGPLASDSAGNLYGLTAESGPELTNGLVFKIAPNGAYSAIALLPDDAGWDAQNGLTRGADGNLYGTTSAGGVNDLGTAFRVTPAGVVKMLGNFTLALGKGVSSPLTLAPDKSLYGVRADGGVGEGGTVFKITPAGKLVKVADMNRPRIGTHPLGALVVGPDRALYGTARYDGWLAGTIFRVGLDGTVKRVGDFFDPPAGGLTYGSDYALYGLDAARYSLFRWPFHGDPTGVQIEGNGLALDGTLIQGVDGRLHALNSAGIVYELGNGTSRANALADTGAANDLAFPQPLTLSRDGQLYGLTSVGYGTVFRCGATEGNAPPVGADDQILVQRGANTLDVVSNDLDPDGDRLAVTSATGAARGDLKVTSLGEVIYTPHADFGGSDSFTYTATDGYGGTTTATVHLRNTAPTAADLTVYPHLAPLAIDVLGYATDPELDVMRIAAVGAPAHGQAAIRGNVIVYTPGPDFMGDDTVTYTLTDDLGGPSAVAKIHLVDKLFGVSGSFSGTIRSSDDPSDLLGTFRLTLSKSGTFTAVFPDGPGRFVGIFDGDGQFEKIYRQHGRQYRLDLHLDPATGKITGTLDNGLSNEVAGGLQAYSATNPFPRAGTYTFAIDSSGLNPQRAQDDYDFGTGYGVATVSASGSVQISGKFCDGAPFSAGTALYGDDSCVFTAATLYGLYESGSISADLHFKDDGTNDLYGQIYDFRLIVLRYLPGGALPTLTLFPPGYYGWLNVAGSLQRGEAPLLSPPAGPGNVTLSLNKDYSVTWDAGDTVQVDTSQKLTLSLNKANGLFRGTFFSPPTAQWLPYSGAILQRQGYGTGLYPFRRGKASAGLAPVP